jgi:hypothetical protein
MQIQTVPIWKIQQNFLRTKTWSEINKKKNQCSKTDFCKIKKWDKSIDDTLTNHKEHAKVVRWVLLVVLMINPLFFVVRWWLWLNIVGCINHQSIVVVAWPFLLLIVGSVEDQFNVLVRCWLWLKIVSCIDHQSTVLGFRSLVILIINPTLLLLVVVEHCWLYW